MMASKGESIVDLHHLKIFQLVAELGSISKAARELNYAQSNVTTKIQQLETLLGTTLFYRHNRGITLTAKGKVLLTYSRKIFNLIEETYKAIQDDQIPKGPLTIGSMETTAAVRLPALLSKYHQDYPDVELILKTGPTEQLIAALLRYELDGAFVAGPVEHPQLLQKKILEEELVLITDRIHPPLTSIKELRNRTLLVFRSGCSYRAKFEQWLRYEGILPNKMMEFGALEAIVGCVAAGLGISLLPFSVVEKYVKNGNIKYHAIPKEFAKVQTLFVYRKDEFMTTAMVKFIEMISMLNEK